MDSAKQEAGGAAAGGDAAVRAVGAHGGNVLREKLADTKDPKATVRTFLEDNSLRTPSCQQAHQLLDLIGFTRADQHLGILLKLKRRLLARLEGAPVDKQLALLEKVFPYISVQELRELPLTILSNLPRVPASYLVTLAQSASLVAELPLPVRRQVWSQPSAEDVFESFLCGAPPGTGGLFHHYYVHPKVQGLGGGLLLAPAGPKKSRAANKALQEIVAAVGDSTLLYTRTLNALAASFEALAPDPALSSLRLHLPLAVQEASGGGPKHLAETDPALKLALALALAGKDKHAPGSLVPVQAAASRVPPLHLAMLLRAPEPASLLEEAVMHALRKAAEEELIPNEVPELKVAVRLLALSSDASLPTLDSVPLPEGNKASRGAPSESEAAATLLLDSVLPALMCALVDDLIRERQGEPEALEPALLEALAASPPARRILLNYALHASSGETPDLERVNQLLASYPPELSESTAAFHLVEEARQVAAIAKKLAAGVATAAKTPSLRPHLATAASLLIPLAKRFAVPPPRRGRVGR